MDIDLDRLIRAHLKPLLKSPNIASGERSGILLDANENSFGSPLKKWYHRYPDPQFKQLKEAIANIKRVDPSMIFLGNGSSECVDLLIRLFCEPGLDHIIVCPPTYSWYERAAQINKVAVKQVPLTPSFQIDLEGLEAAIDPGTKMIFLCSPNNPTGNGLDREDIEMVLNNFDGIVVVDEAYINFSRHRSFLSELKDYPNLVVLQTFSTAWGLAGLRLGMAFASVEIKEALQVLRPSHALSTPVAELAAEALKGLEQLNELTRATVQERHRMKDELSALSVVENVFESEANFILVRVADAKAVHQFLLEKNISVKDCSDVPFCENCLRITIGTSEQNQRLLEVLKKFHR